MKLEGKGSSSRGGAPPSPAGDKLGIGSPLFAKARHVGGCRPSNQLRSAFRKAFWGGRGFVMLCSRRRPRGAAGITGLRLSGAP